MRNTLLMGGIAAAALSLAFVQPAAADGIFDILNVFTPNRVASDQAQQAAAYQANTGLQEGRSAAVVTGAPAPGADATELQMARPAALSTREMMRDPTEEKPGTITVDTKNRYLYLSQADGTAVRYGIGVGRDGFRWSGEARVQRKAEWPDWHPPKEMMKRRPDIPAYMKGGINNPLGARALYLFNTKGDTGFRIHGTNEPDTIGQAVSSGCIRMMNNDVIDLYSRVKPGTKVIVLPG